MADLDDALLAAAAPSDLEAALVYLAGCCPPGALLCGRTLPVLTLAQVYAIVQNHTNVDREVEAQRACGSLLVLQLPAALRDEPLVIQSHEVEAAMRAEAATAPDSKEQRAMELAAKLVRRCAQPRIEEADIVAFLSVEGEPEPSSVLAVAAQSVADTLVRRGWLVPLRSMAVAGLGEAPAVEGTSWLWSLPRCGLLVKAVLEVRADVLRCLDRQRFGRAPRSVVERATAASTRKSQLTLDYVLRDMEGRALLKTDPAASAGASLQLSPAGVQAAAALKKKRKR
eukprot:scaffold27157_cov152-Isochrysis_galbana.AAC.3